MRSGMRFGPAGNQNLAGADPAEFFNLDLQKTFSVQAQQRFIGSHAAAFSAGQYDAREFRFVIHLLLVCSVIAACFSGMPVWGGPFR